MGIAALRRALVCLTVVLALGVPSAAAGLDRPDSPAAPGGAAEVVYRAAAVPDDPLFAQLWALSAASDRDIDAPEAWDVNTGSRSVVVAVIDTGVAYGHPDIAPNLWVNDDPPGGGDQDANGKIDDTHGWDFVQNDATPLDYNGHGTHVAGTLGARGNNARGIPGVAWDVSIMPLRAGDASGNFPASTVADAIEYACSSGADIVNGSFAGPDFSQDVADAITSPLCEHTLFVFPAGNDGADLELTGPGHDAFPCELHRSPAAGGVFAENVLCVAVSDQTDDLAASSNRGATAVHLAAPGVEITSTLPGYAPLPGFPDGFDGAFASRWGDRSVGGGVEWDRTGSPFRLADSPSGPYAANSDTSIRRLAPFSTVGKNGCRLVYDLELETEEDADWLEIGVGTSPDPESIDGHSGSTGGTSVERTTDLSSFDGLSSLFLRFRLLSGPTDERDGAFLDNVSVECLDPAGGEYGAPASTSRAAPHVAGVAALLLSRNPSLGVAQLRAAILDEADPVAVLEGKVFTGGRLNAAAALASVADGAAPETTITAKPAALTRSSTAIFRFTANEAATFECSVDAGAFVPCTSPHLADGLGTGNHTFRVRAIDLVPNVDATPAEHTWTVDVTRPNTTILAGPSGGTAARRAVFRFRSSEAGSTFRCKLDAKPWTTCASPQTYTGLARKQHTFRVRATDRAGNVDATAAQRTWRIR